MSPRLETSGTRKTDSRLRQNRPPVTVSACLRKGNQLQLSGQK
jgi:hypothetical protein